MAGCGLVVSSPGHARLSRGAAAASQSVQRPPGLPLAAASGHPVLAACGTRARNVLTNNRAVQCRSAAAPQAGPPNTASVQSANLPYAAPSATGTELSTSEHKDLDLANNCVPLPGLTVPVAAAAAAASRAAAAGDAGAGIDGALNASHDDIDQYVQNVLENELEHINQAVHAAFEQEMETVNQTVQEAVQTALLDRGFDVKANLNTMVALTGVILYWRGVWNLFDSWLGTDNVAANVGSILTGLSVMLLFRIFKLPLAEFW